LAHPHWEIQFRSDPNTDSFAHANGHAYADGNSHSDTDSHCYADTDSNAHTGSGDSWGHGVANPSYRRRKGDLYSPCYFRCSSGYHG
jgi:hypothetical protein